MKNRKKHNVLRRRARVTRRAVKRLTPKRLGLWFMRSVKGHPLVFGFVFFIWITVGLSRTVERRWTPSLFLSFHAVIFVLWLLLVGLSKLLNDAQPAKWYYRKRFVFFMLVFLTPWGVILMWLGSRFKMATKIILTVVFVSLMALSYIFPYQQFMKKDAIERISDLIAQPKEKIFLMREDASAIKGIQLNYLPQKRKPRLSAEEIAARCSASVVSIKTKDKNGKELGLGSGFVVSQDGVIMTNFHVLQGAYSAEIKFQDIIFENCRLMNGISRLDIALIKVEAKNLPALPLGNSDSLESGQEIIAIGNPWGLERSISNGLVSAVRRWGTLKVIQMTAPVSAGSSGGPIINLFGEVVGITTLASFFGAQNLNFAVPINVIYELTGSRTQ